MHTLVSGYNPNNNFFTRKVGEKNYELTDHLGNVRATVTDRKIASFQYPQGGNWTITGFTADITSAQDYYPFGWTMPGRQYNPDEYRYGFGSHEKVDEIKGSGNHYTAQYWEMDPRLVKRWNPDPIVKPHESPYAILGNNPIWFIDPNGADTVEVFAGSGEFKSHTKAKGNDVFFTIGEDGSRLNQISFDEGTLKGVNRPSVKVKQKDGTVEDRKLTLFDIKGDENATKLFEFFADPENTGVEWTQAKTGTAKDGNNIVGSSHDKSSTPVGHYLRRTGYTLREVTHNHPSGIARPSSGDKSGAKLYHEKNSKTILQIYTHPNNYVEYNQHSLIISLPEIEIIAPKKSDE